MKFYRYEYYVTDEDGDVEIRISTYQSIKETPKGYWISPHGLKHNQKWISKTAKKRYAYPTKEEALNYFIEKSYSHIRHMNWRIEIVKGAIMEAQKLRSEIL